MVNLLINSKFVMPGSAPIKTPPGPAAVRPPQSFRRDFPLGTAQTVVALAEAHAAPQEIERLSEILHCPLTVLLPQMTVKEAASTFEKAESDVLAVVDSQQTRQAIGTLTEQYALRRYSEELDRRRREISGEPNPPPIRIPSRPPDPASGRRCLAM